MKIVAVINDSTGQIQTVLDGYTHRFPYSGMPTKNIDITRQYGEIGEHAIVSIEMNGYEHLVSTEKYSLVYDKEDDE